MARRRATDINASLMPGAFGGLSPAIAPRGELLEMRADAPDMVSRDPGWERPRVMRTVRRAQRRCETGATDVLSSFTPHVVRGRDPLGRKVERLRPRALATA
jgi:hypothetical protein